ncbi:MAG: phosphoenolpyruvate--protein phosphotransferase, partial [Frondihabitans sp.]|nr:phosphoenolpyruvate--protein phosphotransferase [Frondihabitans sp.]
MPDLPGVGVGRGAVSGPVLRMADPLGEPEASALQGDPADAKAAVGEALAYVADELGKRGIAAGGDAQAVLEAQALMAQDPSILDDVHTKIDQGTNPERAVFEAFKSFQDILAGMGGYMGERAADLGDVAQRIIAKLRGVLAPGVPESDTPFILVAHDLAPADTALLDLDKVLALVTRDGGPTSHTAILARAKGITAIVGVSDADSLTDGDVVIVDAGAGVVVTDPTPEQIAEADRARAERLAAAQAPLTPGALADGTLVPLLANLGSPADAAAAVAAGAEGVGLFR